MNTRVPVLNPDGSPAMATKASRARRWVRDGKAVGKWNDLGIYYVQLLQVIMKIKSKNPLFQSQNL